MTKIQYIELPPAINVDGSIREKKDPYDYGLTERAAENEYHERFPKNKKELKDENH